MAARFNFRLEALLDIRKRAEKDKQLVLGRITQEAEVLKRQIRQTERAILDQNRQLTAQQLIGKLDLSYIANEKRFVGSLHMLIVQTMQKLAVVEQRAAVARAELLTASRARKVIDKLREKQFARWREEQEAKEAATMDELGTQMALRQAANEAAAELEQAVTGVDR